MPCQEVGLDATRARCEARRNRAKPQRRCWANSRPPCAGNPVVNTPCPSHGGRRVTLPKITLRTRWPQDPFAKDHAACCWVLLSISPAIVGLRTTKEHRGQSQSDRPAGCLAALYPWLAAATTTTYASARLFDGLGGRSWHGAGRRRREGHLDRHDLAAVMAQKQAVLDLDQDLSGEIGVQEPEYKVGCPPSP